MKHMQHLTAMFLITVVMGLIYMSVQQVYRSDANDPQIGQARDLRDQLQRGSSLYEVIPSDTIDLNNSLALFTQTYSTTGQPVFSTGFLNGKIPALPRGVLNYTSAHGEDWVTWQPAPGVRLAVIVLKVNHPDIQYLAVGRSLREVEERESNLIRMVSLCWLLCLGIIGISWMVQFYFGKKGKLA
jgi:hypothetical protein